jgi:hypothetical protein
LAISWHEISDLAATPYTSLSLSVRPTAHTFGISKPSCLANSSLLSLQADLHSDRSRIFASRQRQKSEMPQEIISIDSQNTRTEVSSLDIPECKPATSALHADEELRLVDDVAPPIHVSTIHKYPDDPDQLRPFHGREIGVRIINSDLSGK